METLQQVSSVLLVFGLLGAALWGARRGMSRKLLFSGRKSQNMQALERLSLTPQHTLHWIRAGGRDLLVATHPHGCTVIQEQPRAERSAA